MLLIYLKIALRNLFRNPFFSAVTISGFALGMAAVVAIGLYIHTEFQYDRFHKHADRVYRLSQILYFEEGQQAQATTSGPLAAAVQAYFPEVEAAVRIFSRQNVLLTYQDKQMYGEDVYFTDASFFDVFGFELLQGDASTALSEPNAVVLTAAAARKFFGSEEALDKVLVINKAEYVVKGILAEAPGPSHLQFDYLASLSTLSQQGWLKLKFVNSLYTYVKLKPGASAEILSQKLPRFTKHFRNEEEFSRAFFHLQPLTKIYLHSNLEAEIGPTGNWVMLRVLGAVGALILLLACINYVNLTTARASRRLKEIGLRKILGAGGKSLGLQFLTEVMLQAVLALVLALCLIELSLPALHQLTGKPLQLVENGKPFLLLGLMLLFVVTGAASGVYPAWYISRFKAVYALTGNIRHKENAGFRKGLVVFQYSVSVVLMIGCGVIYKQINFISKRNIGFNKEQLVQMVVRDGHWRNNMPGLKAELQKLPFVVSATASLDKIGEDPDASDVSLPEAGQGQVHLFSIAAADADYFNTLEIEVLAGRGFSDRFASDTVNAFIINEAGARQFGWTPEEAIGKELVYLGGGRTREKIIGVVKDYNYRSLHQQVAPILIMNWPEQFRYITLKINSQDLPAAMAALEQAWNTISPGYPLEYSFADEQLDKFYASDRKAGQLLSVFTALAILIGGMGLASLVLFAVETRTKEIGIRKVLGASVTNVVMLISKDYIKLVLMANLLAWPLAWWAANKWLEKFAYRVDLSWWLFALAGLSTLLIALFTVSYQAFKAALANPVKSLRTE